MQRQFFSGNSIEQAVMSAARHYKVDPDHLAYTVRDKKHGFLNIRRRVVIEVDPNNLQRSEPEADVVEVVAAPARGVEAFDKAPENGEEGTTARDSGSVAREVSADSFGADVLDAREHEESDRSYDPEPEGEDGRDESEEDSQEDRVDDDQEDRPRARRGRGRRGNQKSRARRQDVTTEEFSWDDDADGWDEPESDDEDESKELVAVEICLERILDVMDLEIEYSIVEGETVEIEFSGEDSDFLIEEDGKVLKAIEHIVPRMARAIIGRSLSVHVDCDGFRADHEESLKRIADSAAEDVVRRGRAKTLNPMNPADRRIVHLALVDHPDVETVSQGHGFMKRVKVVLAD